MIRLTMTDRPMTRSHSKEYDEGDLFSAMHEFIRDMDLEGVDEGNYVIEIECGAEPWERPTCD